jgi:hypothetical protein
MCVNGYTLFRAHYKRAHYKGNHEMYSIAAWKLVPEAIKKHLKEEVKQASAAQIGWAEKPASAALDTAPRHLVRLVATAIITALDAAAAIPATAATAIPTATLASTPIATATAIPIATLASTPIATAYAMPQRPLGISRSTQPDQYPPHPGLFDYPNPLNNFYGRSRFH